MLICLKNKVLEKCVGQSNQYKHVQGRRRNEKHSIRWECSHGSAWAAHMAEYHEC